MIAYSIQEIQNLAIIKEARRWGKQGVIADDQLTVIQMQYKASLYHPNWMIRVLLFVAGLLALSGVTGIFALMFGDLGAIGLSVLCILYGLGSIIFLEEMFIKRGHYKSGITEAVLYHSCGFVIGGVAGLSDFDNTNLILITCIGVFALAALRYLDLFTTLASLISLAALLFFLCYDAGGIVRQLIPFVILFVFAAIYLSVKRIQSSNALVFWRNNMVLTEAVSLVMIYLSTNYWVVREASIELLDLSLAEGEEIPFAGIFYSLTVAIPVLYFIAAIKNKDTVMMRVGMLALALSVSTFKYYFIETNLEWILVLTGGLLMVVVIVLMRNLKDIRGGFTSKPLLTRTWESGQLEALVISQTLGGNQSEVKSTDSGGGGESGGGGASTPF